ncbi:hypothetical protein SAMN05216312_10849 [Cohnella sp. OV330]|uniref:hypothetical protein n=1 Tax=Cohnella sp. OV330 TaxID=1855288 RepID=UPI0008E9FE8D|nr:hypothetical protein [Cohnella sp. OV330]SFB43474.1 hypothetical protein SAMN05216312_10849 [Cohnella sp. OV330]
MISSILDLIVSDLPERTVQMTSGCAYGDENALTEIGDGTEVTLVNGRHSEKAVVRMRSGGECFHGSFELGAALARQLRLTGDKRYKLVYDTERKTLKIGLSPLSAASASIGSDAKLGAGRLSIGYALLSRLGLPDDRRDHTLTLRHGGRSRRLAVRSPANLFESGLNLHPDAVRALKLRTGTAYKLSYDQRSKELVVKPAGSKSAGAGQDKKEANRSGGTNRSTGASRSEGANRSGGVNRSAGANRSGGGSVSHPPASGKKRSTGAAGNRPAPEPNARARTRKPTSPATARDDRPPAARVSKPVRQEKITRPAPVFRTVKGSGAGKRSKSGPAAASTPYMPKGRA